MLAPELPLAALNLYVALFGATSMGVPVGATVAVSFGTSCTTSPGATSAVSGVMVKPVTRCVTTLIEVPASVVNSAHGVNGDTP